MKKMPIKQEEKLMKSLNFVRLIVTCITILIVVFGIIRAYVSNERQTQQNHDDAIEAKLAIEKLDNRVENQLDKLTDKYNNLNIDIKVMQVKQNG